MSNSQSGERQQPKTKRALHSKVRTGCLTCKRRRVRCDERKPYCRGCLRLGHTCEYAPATPAVQPKPPQPPPQPQRQRQRKLLPAPAPMWTEADSLRAAYYNAFQRYDPVGLSNSETFAQVIPREISTDDVFHPICMSLGALSLSSVARSLAGCDDQSLVPLATSSPVDAVHAKAVRYYATALSRLRARLASEGAAPSPRVLLLSMGAMVCFELMQGNLVASGHLQIACFSVLGDAVISPARSGDSDRFGLTALHKDDLAVEEIEAIQIRMAAMSVLGQQGLSRHERTGQRAVPIPRPTPGKLPEPESRTEIFQKSWNAFARMLESWRMACYWSICLNGTSVKLPDFRDDQRILVDCLRSWEKTIRSRIRLSRCLNVDHDHAQALKLLLIYVRSMHLFLAPEDEDAQTLESLRATDLAPIARQPLRSTSRFIGGFLLGSWNDCLCDSRLFLMIKLMVLKRQPHPAAINRRLAQLQLDQAEAIWYTLKQYYEGSGACQDPGFLPVRARVTWTFLYWEHYRVLIQTAINDMDDVDHSSSSDPNTNDSDGRD